MEPAALPGGCCEERLACLGPGGHSCGSHHGTLMEGDSRDQQEGLTEDDIYCRCLSKALCHTATPVTVGFYSPCGHRLYSLLDKVTAFMRQEMARREEAELRRGQPKPRSPRGWGLALALWYLTFYSPIITEAHLRRKNMEFIFIRFSAWQFAGCDKLWAGLVTTLCDSVRQHFGALPLSVYHVLGTPPRYASGFGRREWVLKKGTCLKLWGLLFVLAAGLAVLLVALLVPGIKDHRALQVVGSAVASLSGSSLVLGAFHILKNLLVSEKRKIERLTNSQRFAGQLGFMSKVRGEVEALVGFLSFMEVFERRRLRVVLEITSLDLCLPEKVAGVLTAMGTLLAAAHSPFIFILAVDPSVIVPCLEQAGCLKGLADNGYLYLSRVVTLPFSIPAMGARSRLRCLEAALGTREDLMYRIITSNLAEAARSPPGRRHRSHQHRRHHHHHHHHRHHLPLPPSWQEVDAEAARCIREAFGCLHDASQPLARYLPTDGAHLRRIVNTIPITLRLLLHRAHAAGASPSPARPFPATPPGAGATSSPTPPGAASFPVPPGAASFPVPPGAASFPTPPGATSSPTPPGATSSPTPPGATFFPVPPGATSFAVLPGTDATSSPVPAGVTSSPVPPGAGAAFPAAPDATSPVPPGAGAAFPAAPDATSPLAAAAWVVLADRWPCRLSWALQCLEDAWQAGLAPRLEGRSLWSVYQEQLAELSALRQPLRNLLSLDADPELFRSFLARDFPFGASHAHRLLPVTVNLDHSIRHRMALLRGLDRLQGAAPGPPGRGGHCPAPE